MRTLFLHLSAIYTSHDCSISYWTSVSFATLSSCTASYMISVRQTRDLPRASFRFRIATDTLAFSYVLTANGSHSGLSPVRVRPCWANKKSPSDKSKGRMTRGSTFSSFSFLQKKTSFSHQVTLTKENKKSPLVARTKGRI